MSLAANQPALRQGASSNPAANPRLNSWKEIAAYFDRDIRTVQLWEKRESLPIHRHEHNARSSVYAYPSELDAWLRTRQHDRPASPPSTAARLPRPAWLLISGLLAAATFVAVALHLRHRPDTSTLGPNQTLAVLPFEDLSADNTSGLWVDGLTDDLITGLGAGTNLKVISRHSVLPFKSTHESLATIARQLHATLVLEGTVAHQDDSARITARLVDPATDRQLWTGSYTRHTRDILSIQDEVAASITTAISQQLSLNAPPTSHIATSTDPQVRLAYLTGIYFLNQRDQPGLLKAIDFFQQSIAKDSHYAPSYAGLADCYNLLAVWGNLPSRDAFPKARAAAQTALSLDPTSAQAYTSLAFETYRYEWNFAQAETDFRKAIQLNPSYATAHQWYGEFLGDLRRFDESIAELRRARDLDPLSAIVGSDLAVGYIHAGRDPEAITELHRILALYPDFLPAHNYLASAFYESSDIAKAQQEVDTFTRLSGDTTSQQNFRILDDARAGKLQQARTELSDLRRSSQHTTNFQLAKLYFAVGQPDQAYAALDNCYAEHSWWLVTLMVDPGFASVRNQPRFRALMQRVGLPVSTTTASPVS